MSHFHEFYLTMKDGTIKQINPFSGTEVWSVPERGHKPIVNVKKYDPILFSPKPESDEDYCSFCHQRYDETTPEKDRLVFRNGQYHIVKMPHYNQLTTESACFKRVPNLFEIVSYKYWKENYNYIIDQQLLDWKLNYLSHPAGRNHVLYVINRKLRMSGIDPESVSEDEKLDDLSNSFFAGCHELIIGGKHFKTNALHDRDFCSSGELSSEEHYQYIKFTIYSMSEIFKMNRFVRYIAVYQNWLSPAGASFDHLHKQLVGLDEWGTSIEKKIQAVKENRNIFNEFGANFAGYHDLIFAENDYAIAFADIGHRYPTIAIFSKSVQPYPSHHSEEELRGVSDLLYACHKAMGNELSCNEEWYYTPFDTIDVIPWHILLKWRINTPAGFEGGTEIYINPITPIRVRDIMVTELYKLRSQEKIKNIRIAEECLVIHNPLLYYKYRS